MASASRIRLSPHRYRAITLGALIAICVIVVTGAAVRLTGSGLGCVNWPKCDNNITPPATFHAWVEFGNRLVTGAVSIAVILAVLGSLVRVPRRTDLLRWSLGLVAGVMAQIVWGGVTVLSHLNPAVVSGHFLISMILVWNAVVLHHRAALTDEAGSPNRSRPAMLATITAVWGVIAIATGPLVTGTGPHAGDATDPRVHRFGFDLLNIVRVHSVTMWAFVALIATTAVFIARSASMPVPCRRAAQLLLVVAVAQGGIGYAQYFSGVPPLLVLFHVIGATAVWALTVNLALRTRSVPVSAHERPMMRTSAFVGHPVGGTRMS